MTIKLKQTKKPKKPKVRIEVFRDEVGNVLYVNTRGLNPSIYLKLKVEKRERLIGTLSEKHKFMQVKRKKAKHLHRKSDSYGFNHYVLSNAQRFNKVKVCDDDGQYMVPVKRILQDGEFLFFNAKGFELQIFLKMDIIRGYKLKAAF